MVADLPATAGRYRSSTIPALQLFGAIMESVEADLPFPGKNLYIQLDVIQH